MAQTGPQMSAQRPWLWKPGQSGNPHGPRDRSRAAIQARAIDLAVEFGGWSNLGAGDQQLLIKASELSMRPTLRLDEEAATRISNSISRILSGLRKRHRRPIALADPPHRPRLK